MHASARLATILTIAALGRPALGQAQGARDSAVIAATERRIEADVVARRLGALERAYAPDFRFQHASGEDESRAEWLASVRRGRFAARELDSLDVEVHGDVALTTGRLHVRRAPSDPDWATDPAWREYTIRYARVYARRGGRWLLLTHHSTGQTFGPPSRAAGSAPAR